MRVFILGAFENSRKNGYLTEKIWRAFQAGAIPLYFGSQYVFEAFNPARFIFVDETKVEVALERVKYLYENPEEYAKILDLPLFQKSFLRNSFTLNPQSVFSGRIRSAIKSFAMCPQSYLGFSTLTNYAIPSLCIFFNATSETKEVVHESCSRMETFSWHMWQKLYLKMQGFFLLRHTGTNLCLTNVGNKAVSGNCNHEKGNKSNTR